MGFFSDIVGDIFGGEEKHQTATATSEPWREAQPFLKDIFQQSQDLYRGFQPTFYPGQTFAPQDPLQVAGQQLGLSYILGNQQLPDIQTPQMPQAIPTMTPQGSFPQLQGLSGALAQPPTSGSPAAVNQPLQRPNTGTTGAGFGIPPGLEQYFQSGGGFGGGFF